VTKSAIDQYLTQGGGQPDLLAGRRWRTQM